VDTFTAEWYSPHHITRIIPVFSNVVISVYYLSLPTAVSWELHHAMLHTWWSVDHLGARPGLVQVCVTCELPHMHSLTGLCARGGGVHW
jgi:hypothetical protein